ncbi:unnamed protein product [Prorocentrum cordatum]|uniref:Uncharacterized protein n=1 Tax=Prorocentrum cordatum TaxID=2364126 RepID=A0ABN9WE01_9DINO|nr:unnamed protein product [Polarella glacialis]
MKRKEACALHRLWHLPPQALPRDVLLAIGCWSPALKLAPLELSSRAALMRSASDSVLNWPYWAKRLREAAETALSFYVRTRGHDLYDPLHSKSSPIAHTLEDAAQGFNNDSNKKMASACGSAMIEWTAEAEKARLLLERPKARLRMQKLVRLSLISSLLRDCLPSTVFARFNSWAIPPDRFTLRQIEWESLTELLSSAFPPAAHPALIKTWAGG